jgi:hypothetical protein
MIALHVLSAIGGVFGLWALTHILRDLWNGAHQGIRGHVLKCHKCGQNLFWTHWSDNDGCTHED